jgi:hypothetical protein
MQANRLLVNGEPDRGLARDGPFYARHPSIG